MDAGVRTDKAINNIITKLCLSTPKCISSPLTNPVTVTIKQFRDYSTLNGAFCLSHSLLSPLESGSGVWT